MRMRLDVELNPYYKEAELDVTDASEIEVEFHDKVAEAVADALRSSDLIGFDQEQFRIRIKTK